jgi:hypothetical protein
LQWVWNKRNYIRSFKKKGAIKMGVIKLNGDDVKEIMDALPKDLRGKLVDLMKGHVSERQIERVRRFCAQFEEGDDVDGIIAMTCASLIDQIGNSLTEQMDRNGKNGIHSMCGADAGKIVAQILREEADDIMKAVKKHGSEDPCEHH